MWARRYSEPRAGSALAERRRLRRRIFGIFIFSLLLLLGGVAIWGLWQPAVRVSEVLISNGEEALTEYATQALQGTTYLGIVPRDSIFIFPASEIRRTILAERPSVAAVSISRTSLTSITISVLPRVPLGRWCGLAPTEPSEVPFDGEYCYLFDASGFIFAPATASSTVINTFDTYAPLAGDTLEPLRATLANNELLPAVFDFTRQFSARVAPVKALLVEGDEAHLLLASGARASYVIGNEKLAFQAALSASEATSFTSEDIEYIDLRFEGKVYVKREE